MTDNKDIITRQAREPGKLYRLVVPLCIIGLSVLIVFIMVATSPKPELRQTGERAAVVNLIELAPSNEKVTVKTAGTVTPSTEITLFPRVSGHVAWIDPRFIPGGAFRKDEVILNLDPLDYETAVAGAKALFAKAESDYKAELGMQDIARHEWETLRKMKGKEDFSELETELAMRKPNLLVAQNNLESAKAQLKQAEATLKRASVKAPFNCVVRSRQVNVGSQVTTQTPLSALSGTDSLWIMTTVPVSSTKWIASAGDGDGKGAPVTVSSVPGIDLNAEWEGFVLRKMIDLEKSGKQAQLIVEIPEPGKPVKGNGSLLLGAYVRLEIAGPEEKDIFKIPSSALRAGAYVWMFSPDSRLEIRKVETRWTGRDFTFLSSGVKQGEKIVVSDLGTPVSGMLLQDASAPRPETKQKVEKN